MPRNKRMEMLNRWGLKDNPFTTLPPDKTEDRQRVFTGRASEVSKLFNLVKRPRGIFLCGLFGIGKSILVLETLRLLEAEGFTSAYVKYDPQDGFQLSVLRGLARSVAEHKDDAMAAYDILARGTNSPIPPKGITPDEVENAAYSARNTARALEGIVRLPRKQDRPVVIAVDNLDKFSDVGSIHDIVQETRDLIDAGAAVVLLGHPFGPTTGFSSSTDILFPLALGPLGEEELVEMMGKYLDLTRYRRDENTPSTHPFTSAAAMLMARAISEFELTPRIFNFACQLLLEDATKAAIEVIDEDTVIGRWPSIAKDFLMRTLRDEDRRYLKIIYETGAVSEDTRQAIEEIGGQLAGYIEVRDILMQLVQENVLIEGEQGGKRQLEPNPFLGPKADVFSIVR